jgi:hypothetical protein
MNSTAQRQELQNKIWKFANDIRDSAVLLILTLNGK